MEGRRMPQMEGRRPHAAKQQATKQHATNENEKKQMGNHMQQIEASSQPMEISRQQSSRQQMKMGTSRQQM